MANVRIIRRRIRSVQNTAKVTKAMQMIAASKMRRAQERVVAGRPYAVALSQVLADLANQRPGDDDSVHPLLERRTVRTSLLVHVTPDRGLCGGLSSNINRKSGALILNSDVPVSIITVGKKGRDFMVRSGREVKAVFADLGDRPSLTDTLPISQIISRMYTERHVDQVFLAYSEFVNTITQQPITRQILPMETPNLDSRLGLRDYAYEPDDATLFSALVPRFLEMQIYHAVLENIASEQSARMVAMQNATDNAAGMVDDLTLELNKVRQETITRELLDIVGGVAAVSGT